MTNVEADLFEESQEPSVLSVDPNERKLARRLRIQKRAEALQSKLLAAAGEDAGEGQEAAAADEESLTERQIVASAELLEKLLAEGSEVISNVRVANDARELERRRSARLVREQLLSRLQESARECEARYRRICERWPEILGGKDPLDIHREMRLQREKCDEVLAGKDALVEQLKLQLRLADERYFEDQARQSADLGLLLERIEGQMGSAESAYSGQLELVARALGAEREALLAGFRASWDGLHEQQRQQQLAGELARREVARDYERELERTMSEHDEQARARKIELETECQALQQRLQRAKALCLLNAEKLAYNYNLLKSREEENSLLKAQQKRKINRLQTAIAALQTSLAELQHSSQLQVQALSQHVLKTHGSIAELEHKSRHFARVNDKQYLDIWRMNDESAGDLLRQIFAADQIIHERILGILWEPPAKDLPKIQHLPSYCAALQFCREKRHTAAKSQACSSSASSARHLEASCSDSAETRLEKLLLNNILKQISNSTGYLLENKLQELISWRSEEERTIIQLDNVFQALAISSPEEIDLLLDFFLPYSHCPVCSSSRDDASSKSAAASSMPSAEASSCSDICSGCLDENARELVACVKKEVQSKRSSETSNRQDHLLDCEPEKITECKDFCNNENSSVKGKTRLKCDKGHVLQIQTACVTKALKEMISKCNSDEEKRMLSFEGRLKESQYTISRNLSASDVNKYWSSYRQIFSTQKEQLWDAVLIGLNKYYEVLKERHNLCHEKDNLKKQNNELQRLLESHTTNPEETLSLLQVHSTKHLGYK